MGDRLGIPGVVGILFFCIWTYFASRTICIDKNVFGPLLIAQVKKQQSIAEDQSLRGFALVTPTLMFRCRLKGKSGNSFVGYYPTYSGTPFSPSSTEERLRALNVFGLRLVLKIGRHMRTSKRYPTVALAGGAMQPRPRRGENKFVWGFMAVHPARPREMLQASLIGIASRPFG